MIIIYGVFGEKEKQPFGCFAMRTIFFYNEELIRNEEYEKMDIISCMA